MKRGIIVEPQGRARRGQGQGQAARDTARDRAGRPGTQPGKEESKGTPYTPLLGRNPFTVTPE